jgi:hypothetical protein
MIGYAPISQTLRFREPRAQRLDLYLYPISIPWLMMTYQSWIHTRTYHTCSTVQISQYITVSFTGNYTILVQRDTTINKDKDA